jgi:predicted metal-dependent hydrolase
MDILKLIIMLVLVCVTIALYMRYNHKDMTYVKSDIDGQFYLVRDVSDKQYAANTLARIKQNINTLADYLYDNRGAQENKEYVEYIDRLKEKSRSIIILESTKDSVYTSYSVNKGEQIVFCLRAKRHFNDMHNINLIMYVVLHEISHVACPIYDNHGPLFKKIFGFITRNAIKINIYSKIDFNAHPEDYCGLLITDSIV